MPYSPADNNYHRVGFKGAVMLPMNTRLSTNIGTSQANSDYKLINTDGTNFVKPLMARSRPKTMILS